MKVISSGVEKYEHFVVSNSALIESFESSLRSLSYVLPGRFKDSELVSELLYSSLNLLSYYHDSILNRVAVRDSVLPDISLSPNSASDHQKYLKYWLKKSKSFRWFSNLLSVLKIIETAVEMTVQKKGGTKAKWNIVLLLEITKVIAKLALFAVSGGRPLIHYNNPGRPSEATIQASVNKANQGDSVYVGQKSGKVYPRISTLERNYLAPSVPEPPTTDPSAPAESKSLTLGSSPQKDDEYKNSVLKFLVNQAATVSTLRPQSLVKPLEGVSLALEVIYIIRPLVYVLLLIRYGRKSWKPWIASIVLEIASYSKGLIPFTHNPEKDKIVDEEYRRRLYLLMYALLRGPLYDNYVKSWMDGFKDSMASKPLVSIVSGFIRDYQPFWENYYFQTSGS